jgi:hypothetical protein
VQGEVLAGRYRLDEVLLTDPSAGHALWRGTDSLLNRTVAIELRVPGGRAAEAMISAAVTAGRIVHPCVVGVYDAVDEGDRAFVVREWVEGVPLRDAVREGPLEPNRAAAIARTAAEALAAIHASRHVHGNLQPGTVLLGPDDEITLTDLRLDPASSPQQDVRAIGGLLYTALTGHWPREISAYDTGLPDAVHVDGRLLSPRQVRAGIPGYLDALTMDLLDPSVPAPPASELAAELRRYDVADPDLSPLTAITPEPAERRSPWKRVAVAVAGVSVVGITALLIAANGLPKNGDDFPSSGDPTKGNPTSPSAAPPVAITPASASILDPKGDGAELEGASKAVDNSVATEWRTDTYKSRPDFGGLKDGMGVVVDLGESATVKRVQVRFDQPGATAELRASDNQGTTHQEYPVIAPSQQAGQTIVTFTLTQPGRYRYVLLWITALPPYKTGYGVGVQEIKVTG